MTVKECYDFMGGDYAGVSSRLMKDERILKYLLKFKDSTDYQTMLDALAKEDYETAFRMAHTLKGVSLNLGFGGLQRTSSELCEALRNGKPEGDITGLVKAVEEEYVKVIAAVAQL